MNIFEKLRKGISTKSPEETRAIAKRVAEQLPENQTLKLSGSLGTGKTTFVQGLAGTWSIPDTIKSPTFNLYSIYSGTRQLIHLDAYRLTDPSQAEDLLIEEFLKPPFCLAIEWPENVEGWMNEAAWQLEFSIQEDRSHLVQLVKFPNGA